MTSAAVGDILSQAPIQNLDNRLQSGEQFSLRLALQYCTEKDFLNIFEYYCDRDFRNTALPFLSNCFSSDLATVSMNLQKGLDMLVEKDPKLVQELIVERVKSSALNRIQNGNYQDTKPSPADDATTAAFDAARNAQDEVNAAITAGSAPPDPPLLKPNATVKARLHNELANLGGVVDIFIKNSLDRTILNNENLLTYAIRLCPYEYVLLMERLALNWLLPNAKTNNALLAALDRTANQQFQKPKDKENVTTLISWYSPSGEKGANAMGIKPTCDEPASVRESFKRLDKSPMYSDREKGIIKKWLELPVISQTASMPGALPQQAYY